MTEQLGKFTFVPEAGIEAIMAIISEAKTRQSELVARVEAGEEVIIVRDQRPVARLVPVPHHRDTQDTVADIREARASLASTSKTDLLDWHDVGRR